MRFPLAVPPGVFRNGTEFQSQGRYYDTYLVRWYGQALGPILGWQQRAAGTVTGAARAILPWKDNTGVTRILVGTHSHLYVSSRAGALTDITPSGFTVGRVDATGAGQYSSGNYGSGTYGTPRLDSSLILDATQWTLDTFGQIPIGMSPDDGKLYSWDLNTSDLAAAISGAPTGAAIVVTPEGFIFVLASTDPRTISWCDQRDSSVWTPAAGNQAGDYTLQTQGRLMCGCRIQGGTLILTDIEAFQATYLQNQLVYGFDQKGSGCGAISRQCLVPFELQAAWMSPSGFWRYNGYVQRIECDVFDYIRRDINLLQASKIFGVHNSIYSEIEWRYCSSASSEIDRCVVWNYKDGTWAIGRVARLAGADRGAFQNPIMVDSTGLLYDHETGYSYDGLQPYATTGPITMGNGDMVANVMGMYPDDITVGDVTATFQVKNNRDDSYSSFGPYSLSSQTDLRFAGRQVKVTYTGNVLTDWRVGTPAFEIEMGGSR